MPNIIEITDIAAPRLDPYVRLTEAQLKNRLHPEDGLFIAESPKVIGYALDAGYEPVSLLMKESLFERSKKSQTSFWLKISSLRR